MIYKDQVNSTKEGKIIPTIKKEDLADIATLTRFERIPTNIFTTSMAASKAVAGEIAVMIKIKELMGEKCVLGMVTGSTPIQLYQELVRMHKEEGLSFKNVVTFNLFEYFPTPPDKVLICKEFMNEHLFNHVDIDRENINYIDATVSLEKIREECENYERKIESYGGVDLGILGLGRTGHIGFNEPGSPKKSRTRMVTLDNTTLIDSGSTFEGMKNIPRKVITLGISNILDAKKLILMALGDEKSDIIKKTIEEQITEHVPASFLQTHQKASVVIDEAAGAELTRIKTPWLIGACKWDDQLIRKGVVWLCQKVNKPILKLTDKDYNDNGMNDLVTEMGNAYSINIKVFNDLQHTITGWPGGKPKADDKQRPERADPFPKRVIIFSPHPDDDVISMGGTLLRLVEQGHEVHTAYQVSGNLAVQDDEAIRFAGFVKEFSQELLNNGKEINDFYDKIAAFIVNKKSGEVDMEEIRKIKGLIRQGEAKAACRYAKIPVERVHFLNMPFYETGKVKKKPLGKEDIQIIIDLIKKLKPHQIFAAGDLSDPHGTHRVCLDAIFKAVEQIKNEDWMKDCWLWLYRGAWQEWDIDQVDMAVPISPTELRKKRFSIFKHQSQKDGVVFQGDDSREFWQRAEDRNRETANLYDHLGMAEYEAIEAFVRYIY